MTTSSYRSSVPLGGKRRASTSLVDLALQQRSPADRLIRTPHRAETRYDHSTPLLAHHSCVNALAISNGDSGQWLATGGDDKRVLLWRTTADLTQEQPRSTYKGARANIFSIAFDCDSKRIFSGGNDNTVLMHDLETGHSAMASTSNSRSTDQAPSTGSSSSIAPTEAWYHHYDSVHRVRCHPFNSNLFMSASDDGTVLSYDLRTSGAVVSSLSDQVEMSDVAYHPQQPDSIFATGDSGGGLLLHDARKALSTGTDNLGRTAKEVAVQSFHTTLSRHKRKEDGSIVAKTGIPSVSSISFSPNGSLLSATLTGHLPTFYEIASPLPVFNLSSPASEMEENRPGHDTVVEYRNGVTVKHGGFGGSEQTGLRYAEGSDDFRAYVWDLPSSLDLLKEQRKRYSTMTEFHQGETPGTVAYLSSVQDSTPMVIPSISKPASILTPHRSIVNTCLFHPTLPLIFTSGVEKVIWAHSIYPFNDARTKSSPLSSVPRTRRHPQPGISYMSLLASELSGRRSGAGETKEEREERLRKEDEEVLQYFDLLIMTDQSDVWRIPSTGAQGEDSSDEDFENEVDDDDEGDGGRDQSDEDDDDDGIGEEYRSDSSALDGARSIEQDSDSGVDPEEYP